MKRYLLKIELLPIDEQGCHIFIPGRINGKKARFLIDSGASFTVVDQQRISRFFESGNPELQKVKGLSRGFGTSNIKSSALVLGSLSFGRLVLRNRTVLAVDFSHVNQSYEFLKLEKIDGVIGGDLLRLLQAVINYRKATIMLSR